MASQKARPSAAGADSLPLPLLSLGLEMTCAHQMRDTGSRSWICPWMKHRRGATGFRSLQEATHQRLATRWPDVTRTLGRVSLEQWAQ